MDVLALMEILTQLQVLLPMDMVLTRLRPSRPMAQGSVPQAEALKFLMSLGMRSGEANKTYACVLQLGPQVDRREVEVRAPNKAAHGQTA